MVIDLRNECDTLKFMSVFFETKQRRDKSENKETPTISTNKKGRCNTSPLKHETELKRCCPARHPVQAIERFEPVQPLR